MKNKVYKTVRIDELTYNLLNTYCKLTEKSKVEVLLEIVAPVLNNKLEEKKIIIKK